MPPKESPTHNGGVTASLVKCCSAKFSHTVYEQIMIFFCVLFGLSFFAFLEFFFTSEDNLLLLSSRLFPLCVCFLLVFFPVFHMFYVCVCILYIFFCMYLCVFVYIYVCIFLCIYYFFPNVRKICSLSSEQSIRYPCSVQYICISPVLLWQYVCV